MAGLTETLKILIDGQATGAVKALAETGSASEALQAKTTLTGKAMEKLGLQGVETGAVLKTALVGGAAVAGAAVAKFALDGVQAFADLTSQVRGFQRVTGAGAEDASKLTFAVRELGIAPETASTAFGRLATRIGGNKTVLLEQAGLIERNKDGTVNLAATVANLSDAYQKTEDPTKRAALANDAFGRSWQTLAPLLGKGKQDLQEIYAEAGKDHQIFSQADLEAGRQYGLATAQLKDAITGLKVELGQALIPVVTQATSGLTQGIQATDSATSALGGLAGVAKIVAGNVNVYGNAMSGVDAITSLASGHFEDAGKSALEAIPGIGGFAHALFDGTDSSSKFEDATTRVHKAQLDLTNVLADSSAKHRDVKAAQVELLSATEDLNAMQNKLQGSLNKVNDELKTHTQALYDDAIAAQTAAGDQISLENAVDNVRQKFDDLTTTQYLAAASGDTSAETMRKVAQGQRDLATAVLQTVSAAEKQAVDNLGPNATAAEKMEAATNAQKFALATLQNQFPGLRDEIQKYIDKLGGVPSDVTTTIHHNIATVLGDIGVLNQAIANLPSDVYVTVHHTIEGVGF